MHITVAICTWNRANLLDQTLARMHTLHIPEPVEWELLVVNNNCTDHTDQVIEHHGQHLPIRRLFEPKAGQSNARNCAVAAAQGDLLLWTDDDVVVDPQWISDYVAAATAYPDATFFGGPILPWFEGRVPRWLELTWSRVANVYAIRDLGPMPKPIDENNLPVGANFAVRLLAQKHYLYDPDLGRKKTGMLGNDETTVIRAMLRDGLQGGWVPTARVDHYIPKDRQTVGYVRRWFEGHGELAGRASLHRNEPLFFGRPRWIWRKAVEAEVRYRLKRLMCRPSPQWIEDLIEASLAWGQLRAVEYIGS
ncbi:MAG: glycosyltransferase [Pirellulaceae bacterium]